MDTLDNRRTDVEECVVYDGEEGGREGLRSSGCLHQRD